MDVNTGAQVSEGNGHPQVHAECHGRGEQVIEQPLLSADAPGVGVVGVDGLVVVVRVVVGGVLVLRLMAVPAAQLEHQADDDEAVGDLHVCLQVVGSDCGAGDLWLLFMHQVQCRTRSERPIVAIEGVL